MNKYPMKLRPVFRDTIWGGDLLKREYNKHSDAERVAESWELTVRSDGMSVIDNGEYAGMTLADYLGLKPDASGNYDFPLLIKFIDAQQDLSVQVHPNKTELWYIVEAKPGAKLVYGLKDNFDEASFRAAAANGKLDELLRTVDVHAGEYYLLPSGQIHAICGGILIAEFQQNSNITYRVWDYNRGREIHTEAAIETMKRLHVNGDFSGMTKSDYFRVSRHIIKAGDKIKLNFDASFAHLLCLSGNGIIGGTAFEKGDGIYLPVSGCDVAADAKNGTVLMLCEPK